MKDTASLTESKYTVSGYFEGIEGDHAVGWALLKEQPSRRLKIDIFCKEVLVASGFANKRREDLEREKKSDGFHLFRLPLSDELYNNCSHTLTAKISGTNIVLPGGPWCTARLSRKREFPLMSRSEGLEILNSLLSTVPGLALGKQQEQYNLAYSLGALSQETRLYEESEAIWSVFEKTLGESSFLFYKRGEAKLLQNDLIGAKEYFLNSIKLDPNFAWGHIGLGNYYLKSKMFSEAENSYSQAFKCNPQLESLRGYATSCLDMQLITKAENLLSLKKTQEACNLLRNALFQEQHSTAIERKYNEALCLAHIPTSPHLDIAIKARTKAELLKHKLVYAEHFIEHSQLPKKQSANKRRLTSKDRK